MPCRNSYQVQNKLGEGGFGAVYQVSRKDSEKKFAAKIIKDKKRGREEVNILERLENEFILRLVDIIKQQTLQSEQLDLSRPLKTRKILSLSPSFLRAENCLRKLWKKENCWSQIVVFTSAKCVR